MKVNKSTQKRLNFLFGIFILGMALTLFSFANGVFHDFYIELNHEEIVVDGIKKDKVIYPFDISTIEDLSKDYLKMKLNDTLTVYPRTINAEIVVDNINSLRDTRLKHWSYVFAVLANIVLLLMIGLILWIMINFMRGIKKGNPFPAISACILRFIAIGMVAYLLFDVLARLHNIDSLSYLFDNTAYNIVGILEISASDFMLFISALIMAELVSFAGKLYEENELTI